MCDRQHKILQITILYYNVDFTNKDILNGERNMAGTLAFFIQIVQLLTINVCLPKRLKTIF